MAATRKPARRTGTWCFFRFVELAEMEAASHDRAHCRGHVINAKPLLWEADGKVYCFGTWAPLCGDELHDPIAEAIAVHAHKERIIMHEQSGGAKR